MNVKMWKPNQTNHEIHKESRPYLPNRRAEKIPKTCGLAPSCSTRHRNRPLTWSQSGNRRTSSKRGGADYWIQGGLQNFLTAIETSANNQVVSDREGLDEVSAGANHRPSPSLRHSNVARPCVAHSICKMGRMADNRMMLPDGSVRVHHSAHVGHR